MATTNAVPRDACKPGERAVAPDRLFCIVCDRRAEESLIEVDAGDPFPLCPKCQERNQPETDQLWAPLSLRDRYRKMIVSRSRETWKS